MLEAKGLTKCYASIPAVYLWLMGPAVLGISKLFLKFREDEFDAKELIFEESPAPAVEWLNLTGRLPNS